MKKIGFIFLSILLVGIVGAYIFFKDYQIFLNKDFSFNFKIEKGENPTIVTEKLCELENFNNKCLYLKAFLFQNKYNNIKPGEYTFSGQNIKEVFQQFIKGPKVKYKKFTILEGYTIYDIAKHLDPSISEKFISLTQDKNFVRKLKNKYSSLNNFGDINSLEGFLYPDTYFFKKSDLNSIFFPELLIETAVKNFDKKWKKVYSKCKTDKKCNPYKLSNYEILILASIVEKEERNKKNKPDVAGILTKRYKSKWLIGADWTLCYHFKTSSNNCKKYLNYRYLRDKKNPYNTRAVLGLPPTPVGNPSLESIQSVLYPNKNNYRYYLHDKHGIIHFGKNAAEHNRNKNKYLR